MTKAELEQYRAICAEIKQLKKEIDEESNDIVKDTVQASSGPGCTMGHVVIEGLSVESCKKLYTLYAKLTQKKADRIRLRDEIENYLDTLDHKSAVILRGKYIEGLTWRQVAQKLGKGESCVKVAVHRMFTS